MKDLVFRLATVDLLLPMPVGSVAAQTPSPDREAAG